MPNQEGSYLPYDLRQSCRRPWLLRAMLGGAPGGKPAMLGGAGELAATCNWPLESLLKGTMGPYTLYRGYVE